MNLRQLRYLKEVATNGFSISKAARSLHTSQPGISQQIISLEDELQVTIFIREKKRIVGLTAQGKEIVARAQSALLEIDSIPKLAALGAADDGGQLTIATTHTQARYVLPEALQRFSVQHPRARVELQHGSPAQIEQAVISGAADIGITPHVAFPARDLVSFECRRYQRIVLARDGHPLLGKQSCSLADIAAHPLITFEQSIAARQAVLDVFEAASLTPNIVLSAIDADVVKACIERGLGLGIVTDVTYDPVRDLCLKRLPVADIFPPGITNVAIRRKAHLDQLALDFIEIFAPQARLGSGGRRG